jgi:hypothetical protein
MHITPTAEPSPLGPTISPPPCSPVPVMNWHAMEAKRAPTLVFPPATQITTAPELLPLALLPAALTQSADRQELGRMDNSPVIVEHLEPTLA